MSAPSGPESGAVTKATQTEDDWNEIKADVKKILETVQSLAPKLKPNETERQFVCDPELWGREIRPTPAKLELYVDLLLRMFLDNENEDGMTTMPSINPKSIVRWPSFANKLSLRFPHIKDWSSGYMAPELAAEAREHLLSNIAKANTISGPWPIDQTTDQWSWDLASGSFELYVGCGEANGKRFSPWGFYNYRSTGIVQKI
ncbi:hypothetical protein F4859DRAFT_2003 [Xylaria cf. heliscus]|nr:hypothetical protein F4859DRAFT_2003 [Xylaria cf. heliscus]